MTWTRVQAITGAFAAGPTTNVSGSAGAAVAVGDVVMVHTCYDDTGSFTDTVSDQLGNTYALVVRKTNATSNQASALYRCVVTVAGTPTIKQQYNPTPGTSTGVAVGFAADHFTGSNAASAGDGSSSNAPNAPGTATDALTGGAATTATDGDLIFAGMQDCSTNGTITAGTGFTASATLNGGAGNLLLQNEWKTQTTHGSITPTGTVANGTDNYVMVWGATTPAGAGTGSDVLIRYGNVALALGSGLITAAFASTAVATLGGGYYLQRRLQDALTTMDDL